MPTPRRAAVGAVVALAVALGLLVAGATPAAAHAELVASDPPAGSPLDAAPAEIVLMFSDAVDPAGADVQVLDVDGVDVAAAPVTNRAGDATTLVVPTTGVAAPGALSVVWTLVGPDGHVMTGMLGYTVGTGVPASDVPLTAGEALGAAAAAPTPADAAAAVASAADATVPSAEPAPAALEAAAAAEDRARAAERLASLARPSSYVGFALLLGLPLFGLCVWPAGARSASARVLHAGGTVAGVAGAVLVYSSLAVGLGAGGGIGTGLRRALDTRAGAWALVEVVLAVVVAVLGVALLRGDRPPDRRWRWSAGASGGALLLAHARVGHAATGGWWTTAIHATHVGAMSAWIGGLVGLLLVAIPAWSSKGVLKQRFHEHLQAFTRLAGAAVGTLLWSGGLLLIMTWSDGRGFGPEYRTRLAIKFGAVLVALAAGYACHRLVRDAPVRPTNRPPVRSQVLTRRLAAEIALSTAVLAATAVLAGTSPNT